MFSLCHLPNYAEIRIQVGHTYDMHCFSVVLDPQTCRLFVDQDPVFGYTVADSHVLVSFWSQKLLVGDFPHELDVEELEEDVPKRKNRTKGRVKHSSIITRYARSCGH